MRTVCLVLLTALGSGLQSQAALPPLPARTTGWILSTTAAWMAAGAAGAWFPVWPLLLLGVVGGFVDARAKSRQLWIAGDVVVVATLWAGLSEFRWAVPGDTVRAALIPGIVIACGLSGVMIRALIDM